MSAALALKSLESLPRTPASDVKKLGWRGMMKAMARNGQVLVTNHDEPEAVILPVEEYAAILEVLREMSARDEAMLDNLRRKYDERLKVLQTPEAREKIRTILRRTLKLDGQVIAGEGH
ncbi:type II toxin-antitoxin system Phd/YefM family antitoxin [Solilutibacter silvestris]|uniref:Antitoxin Phd/YefM protein n=1 Tax=Solilutibacter silvestris TaxID=1645665 RepID=A0A2K1Q1G1_9GAMM|nr:type II toxin-antitoxin system Phd/YefM family antitoxin [Lysobacter silvestris]PNS08880.1 Antitoxin Phd/YefM protein [Lysobacter silvestris]